MKKRTQDNFVRTALRLPPELHKRVHEAAAACERTFNAELIARIEASFRLSDENEALTDQITEGKRHARVMAPAFATLLEQERKRDGKKTSPLKSAFLDAIEASTHSMAKSGEVDAYPFVGVIRKILQGEFGTGPSSEVTQLAATDGSDGPAASQESARAAASKKPRPPSKSK